MSSYADAATVVGSEWWTAAGPASQPRRLL